MMSNKLIKMHRKSLSVPLCKFKNITNFLKILQKIKLIPEKIHLISCKKHKIRSTT